MIDLNELTGFEYKDYCFDCECYPEQDPVKEIYCSVICDFAKEFSRGDLLEDAYCENINLCNPCRRYFYKDFPGREYGPGNIGTQTHEHLLEISKAICSQYMKEQRKKFKIDLII